MAMMHVDREASKKAFLKKLQFGRVGPKPEPWIGTDWVWPNNKTPTGQNEVEIWGISQYFWNEGYHKRVIRSVGGGTRLKMVANEEGFVDKSLRGMTVWSKGFDDLCPERALGMKEWWTWENLAPVLERLLVKEDGYQMPLSSPDMPPEIGELIIKVKIEKMYVRWLMGEGRIFDGTVDEMEELGNVFGAGIKEKYVQTVKYIEAEAKERKCMARNDFRCHCKICRCGCDDCWEEEIERCEGVIEPGE